MLSLGSRMVEQQVDADLDVQDCPSLGYCLSGVKNVLSLCVIFHLALSIHSPSKKTCWFISFAKLCVWSVIQCVDSCSVPWTGSYKDKVFSKEK